MIYFSIFCLIVTLILVIVFVLFKFIAPARLGRVVYGFGVAIESKLYGFEESQVNIKEMTMSYYKNNFSPNKETILMLHGFSSDKVVWLRFARHLTDQYNVLIPDMAGHGKTGYDKKWNYQAPTQAARLVEFIEQLNLHQVKVDKVHIIGNSMGGLISAHFAKLYPEKTLSTTLVDPAGVESPNESEMGKMLTEGRNPFEIHNRAEFDHFYAMTMHAPPWLPDFIFETITEKYVKTRVQLMHIFSDFALNDMLDSSLHEITGPVLLLWGEEDRIINVSSVEVWKAGIKNITVKVWPDIGHVPMFEIPYKSAAVYKDFLKQLN